MHAPLFPLLLLGLSASFNQTPASDTPTAPAKTQVFVLGMIHGGHRSSELWGLDQVRETLRNIQPELMCVEIPPENWPSTLATWKARKVVEDSRVRVFPEYVDVLMPLSDEIPFEVAPCAGWTREMAVARSARIKRFGTSEADAVASAAYTKDEAWTAAWLASHPEQYSDDDPFYIHSPAYDLRTKVELGPYEHHLNEVIGWPGGWTYINHEHFALVKEAIEANPGKRIVVTFGAAHKYWFLEQLRNMPSVELMDVRDYLPAAKQHRLDQEASAQEALLTGLDHLRAWWSDSRGTSEQAWPQFKAALDLGSSDPLWKALKATRGSQPSEFERGPILGLPQLEAHEGNTWSLEIEVRRRGDLAADAQWLRADLQADPTRPSGFRWTKLEIPAWLLEQRRP